MKLWSRVFLVWLVGVVTWSGPLPAEPIKIDHPAPPLHLEKLLQAPNGAQATLESLRGKAVVLEFWATWCGPCVQAITHMNELVKDMEGEPIQFLAITGEKEEAVAPFLEKRAIAGWVGLDTNRSVFDAYSVFGIPRTILVDREGFVRAHTVPKMVTAQVLRDLVAGRALDIPNDNGVIPGPAAILGGNGVAPLFQVSIRPSTSDDKWGQFSRGAYLTAGTTVKAALSYAYLIPLTRIVFLPDAPEYRYDIAVVPAGEEELVKPLLKQALATTFDLDARHEVRERDVHVLVKAENYEGKSKESGTGGSSFETAFGRIEGVNMSPAQIAQALESVLGSPVVEETRLAGAYDVQLLWEPDNSDSLTAVLLDPLGLELRKARRRIDVLVVDKVE